MQNSSSSTPPSIKPQHRIAKKNSRAIRRRRIDLQCGCSIYMHIDCRGHGFTHRGTHHATSSGEWRLYLGGAQSPLFQDNKRGGFTPRKHKSVPHPNTVQPQPEESIASPQELPQLPDMDDFTDSFWDDIFN
ncbi:trans-acting protein [Tomato golden net virus]|uniref:Transcriptional activator protein n=1 Tax=Tomato golden net virus TaxID=2761153 RepID=A0A7G5F340_9GEMI|nr:trans-acting protein [Tomato golden net virus]